MGWEGVAGILPHKWCRGEYVAMIHGVQNVLGGGACSCSSCKNIRMHAAGWHRKYSAKIPNHSLV